MSISVIKNFDAAASGYDHAASVQADVAQQLLDWSTADNPASILDLGAGTGHVAYAAQQKWPQAGIVAADGSNAMLLQAKQKVPQLLTIQTDILDYNPQQKFDAIYSSMVLHWLPDPLKLLQLWRSWLRPYGKLFVALPVDGSFHEWHALCSQYKIESGLWPLPNASFADSLAARMLKKDITVTYASPLTFLRNWKTTGVITPRTDHKPASTGKMLRLVKSHNQALALTYRLVWLEIPAPAP